MRSFAQRFSVGRVITMAWFLGSGYFAFTVNADTSPAPERARVWVLRQGNLSGISAAEFASYPKAYRVEVYNAVSTETKRRLWLEHLASIALRSDLTQSQRDFVLQFTNDMRADERLFTHEEYGATKCADAAKLFADSDDANLFKFMSIGVALPPALTVRSRLLSLSERVASLASAHANIVPCECDGACDCLFKYSDLDVSCDSGATCWGVSTCGCVISGLCTGICYCWVGSTPYRCSEIPLALRSEALQ